MDCKIDPSLLIDFHFGHLSLTDRDQVETHLRSCPSCLESFFLLKRDTENAQAEPVSLPVGLEEQAMGYFESHRQSIWPEQQRLWLAAHRKKLVFGGLAAAAAVLLIVLASGLFFSLPQTSAPTHERQDDASSELIDRASSTPAHINIL